MAEQNLATTSNFPSTYYCAVCSSMQGWQPHMCPNASFYPNPPASTTTTAPSLTITTQTMPCEHCWCLSIKAESSKYLAGNFYRLKPHEMCCRCESRRVKVRKQRG